MGISCIVNLPSNVRVVDVANVLGVLAGLKPVRKEITGANPDSVFVCVLGVKVSSTAIPQAALIELSAPGEPMVDREVYHSTWYHFESPEGGRVLSGPATAFWIAAFRGLADFFGGTVDYNDCDDSDVDYEVPESANNSPTDGSRWNSFQRKVLNLEPLSPECLDAAYQFSAWRKETEESDDE